MFGFAPYHTFQPNHAPQFNRFAPAFGSTSASFSTPVGTVAPMYSHFRHWPAFPTVANPLTSTAAQSPVYLPSTVTATPWSGVPHWPVQSTVVQPPSPISVPSPHTLTPILSQCPTANALPILTGSWPVDPSSVLPQSPLDPSHSASDINDRIAASAAAAEAAVEPLRCISSLAPSDFLSALRDFAVRIAADPAALRAAALAASDALISPPMAFEDVPCDSLAAPADGGMWAKIAEALVPHHDAFAVADVADADAAAALAAAAAATAAAYGSTSAAASRKPDGGSPTAKPVCRMRATAPLPPAAAGGAGDEEEPPINAEAVGECGSNSVVDGILEWLETVGRLVTASEADRSWPSE